MPKKFGGKRDSISEDLTTTYTVFYPLGRLSSSFVAITLFSQPRPQSDTRPDDRRRKLSFDDEESSHGHFVEHFGRDAEATLLSPFSTPAAAPGRCRRRRREREAAQGVLGSLPLPPGHKPSNPNPKTLLLLLFF